MLNLNKLFGGICPFSYSRLGKARRGKARLGEAKQGKLPFFTKKDS